MRRRDFLGSGLSVALGAGFAGPAAFAEPFGRLRDDAAKSTALYSQSDRLDQGPFPTEQDHGWRTLATTTPSREHVRNYGTGLVGYTWEENGPALRVRHGQQKLEEAVERMAGLPFVDVLYIRCDWRDVQSRPGQLNLNPVFDLTLDAARRHGLRFAFRVQLSNPEFEPEKLAIPEFLRNKVPLVPIGKMKRHGRDVTFVEPRYDDPAFQSAFWEMNELLADRFANEPLLEWMDLMMYGFWGEGHTSNLPNPFPDPLTAQKTLLNMTELQIETWKKVPLAVNTQPDISHVGNDAVRDLAIRNGCWLRSDSILVEEAIQIDQLANRPPCLPVIMEDGAYRDYDIATIPVDSSGVNLRENAMLHVLDLGANYWALWTEAENLEKYNERYPEGFRELGRRMGYRIRPAWIWQRKRSGTMPSETMPSETMELIIGVANDGVAAIPGTLRLRIESADGALHRSGSLDHGQPAGGKLRQAAFRLPPSLGTIDLKLFAEIEGKGGVRRSVQWSCAQKLNPDGSFPVKLQAADARGWRKGV